MPVHQIVWLPGFFTGCLHAVRVDKPARPMVFDGVQILWSICGAPAAVVDRSADGRPCHGCQARTGGGDQPMSIS